MGRSRGYDEEVVLAGAMHAFRRKGYSATSIRDLEGATGLKAGSLYNSFGDKAGTFEAAFAHYNRAVLGGRLLAHANPVAGLEGLRALFTSLLHEPDGEHFGCLITNTAIEFGGASGAPPGVKAGLDALLAVFSERLTQAVRAGLLPKDVDPAVTAQRLLALYQGLLVLVRADHPAVMLQAVIDETFNLLERRP